MRQFQSNGGQCAQYWWTLVAKPITGMVVGARDIGCMDALGRDPHFSGNDMSRLVLPCILEGRAMVPAFSGFRKNWELKDPSVLILATAHAAI